MVLDWLFSRRETDPYDPYFTGPWGQVSTEAGIDIEPTQAMQMSAVYACVRVLSDSIASLPLFVYRRLDEGKRKAPEAPAYKILHHAPNQVMTSFTWREVMMAHVLLWGNHFSRIGRNNAGELKWIMPLLPYHVQLKTVDGILQYRWKPDTADEIVLASDEVLHVPGLGYDGFLGYSVIGYAREAIGLGLATEKFGARWFGAGSRPSGVFTHPGAPSAKARENLRKWLDENYKGMDKSHRMMLMWEGVKWEPIGVPPEDAQFLETRKFQVNEIARMFRVPPHMVGDLERATFSNVEQQAIDFVVHTLRPWLVKIEQEINRKLFVGHGHDDLFCEFNVDGLLRGDFESRMRGYAVARQNGLHSINEQRKLENQNPIGPEGDVHMVQLNMQPASALLLDGKAKDEADKESNSRIVRAYARLFEAAERRVIAKEQREIGKALDRLEKNANVERFYTWLSDFYDDHMTAVVEAFRAPVASLAEAISIRATEQEVELLLRELAKEQLDIRVFSLLVHKAAGSRPEDVRAMLDAARNEIGAWMDVSQQHVRDTIKRCLVTLFAMSTIPLTKDNDDAISK